MSDTEKDKLYRKMGRLFVPGPLLLFATGWVNTGSSSSIPIWLLVVLLGISVPSSLAFYVAALRLHHASKEE